MGCSNSNCDCSHQPEVNDDKKDEVKDFNFEKKYDCFKKTLKKIKIENHSTLNDIYLLSVKSIPNFIKFIEQEEVLENLNTDNNDDNKRFKEKFFNGNKTYRLDKIIIIYDSYQNCKDIAEENRTNENAFIMVEKDFIELIKDNNKLINKKVILNKNQMKIKFHSNLLKIKEKTNVIYEFKKEKKEKEDNFNPRTKINNIYI